MFLRGLVGECLDLIPQLQVLLDALHPSLGYWSVGEKPRQEWIEKKKNGAVENEGNRNKELEMEVGDGSEDGSGKEDEGGGGGRIGKVRKWEWKGKSVKEARGILQGKTKIEENRGNAKDEGESKRWRT